MTSIPADIQKTAEIAVVAFETRIQSGEFEGLDPDGTEARDALKAEIAKALMAERESCALRNIATTGIHVKDAVALERERCAMAATEQTFDAHELAQATDYGRGMDHAARTILAAIRSPQTSPTAGAAS